MECKNKHDKASHQTNNCSSAGCGCCGHDHNYDGESGSEWRRDLLRCGIAFGLLLVAVLGQFSPLYRNILVIAAYLLAGYNVLWLALRNVLRGKVFDENFLMSLASLGALAIGEVTEAAAVMIFYGVGEVLQSAAVVRSKRNIANLMDLDSEDEHVLRNGELLTVAPETVQVGEVIQVRPGEKIPLDGVVLSGEAYLDTQSLTGESEPRRVEPQTEVYSGTCCLDAVLQITVTKNFSNSTAAKIHAMVQAAAQRKAGMEKFITRFAAKYTPIVVGLAVLTAVIPPIFFNGNWNEWIYKALSLLIISCPCALVLSIPLSYFGGIGGAARQGILVKGGNALEQLSRLETVAFDKTGTLTTGKFTVSGYYPAENSSLGEMQSYLVLAESGSNHPIALAIVEAGRQLKIADYQVKYRRELSGLGVEVELGDGTFLHAGNAELMRHIGINEFPQYPQTTVYLAKNRIFAGAATVCDTIRPEADNAIAALRKLGLHRLLMLTGDKPSAAQQVANTLRLDEFHAGLLPQDKIIELEKAMSANSANGLTAFVGDGINDAPVLTRADLGIALGGIGSDAAIAAADVVIMANDLQKLPQAICHGRQTQKIVTQNIVLSIGLKVLIMLFAMLNLATIWMAIFADVGIALLAVMNALRTLRRISL